MGAAAESVLRSHFEAPLLQGAAVDVRVDDAQLRRAVVALRVLAPNALRPIEDLVPLLYPGVKVSYGTIQQMLVEAEGRAARFNAQVSLAGVEAGALDEMFSQGEPVLAGVDLDSGYLFGLSLSATRDGEAWAELLREGQCQGLELSVVVKDAARGIAAGVSEVCPHAEQRDDCFHVLYEMHKVRRRLERRAYGAIERASEALGRLGKIRACDKARRRKAKHALSRARCECAEAIGRFEAFEAAVDTLRGALECVDIDTGELHRPEHVQALIEGVAQRIESLGVGECAKLAKYLRNRAPGLVLAQKSVLPRLEALAEPWSAQAVSLACLCWYLVRALHKRPPPTPGIVRCIVICSPPTGPCKTGWTRRALRCARPSRRCCTSAIAPRAPSRGSMRHCAPISTCTRAPPRAFSTCSVPGSICARGAGDGTRGPALTSA